MYTQISAEILTNQKLNDLRKEAEQVRLLNQVGASGRERDTFIGWLFSWIFGKPAVKPDSQPIRTV